ncbi:flagellar basal body rod protein FlgG [Paenibacillus turpanensis]|uniref:flagellar basal body rod protein FlgG n=1 Tax=Paenibacillus turpanensis TaxID=2689078 RepID=UPI001409958F|nr:flagellar basal body rod protein FlgG [Paenibacillus turpanensis]
MIRSLYSGISGMRGFQTKLDVIGNNIANVNTTGFKASRVMFKDMLSQTISGVTAPADGRGGVNAKQIGLGSTLGSIDTLHTPGSAMTTNVVTDLRIDGDGFFVVSPDGEQQFLTRAGNFTLDSERKLVTSDGMLVLSTDGEGVTLEEDVTAFSISTSGEIVAINAEGVAEGTGTFIAVAKVTNPAGLEKIGSNMYRVTPNANLDEIDIAVGANNTEIGTGAIISGQLEMSNVDLTNEFTEMIVAQRGFQANSRIITTSDSVLEEIVNLKR